MSSETTVAGLNSAAGVGCNATGADWVGNVSGACPLVNRAAGDYRLVTGVANPCKDAGVAASLAGLAPEWDFEGEPRAAPYDIGADESP